MRSYAEKVDIVLLGVEPYQQKITFDMAFIAILVLSYEPMLF